MSWLRITVVLVRAMFRDRTELATENLALRQQQNRHAALRINRRQKVRPVA